jgi:type VI secretion system secreted protein VgrG
MTNTRRLTTTSITSQSGTHTRVERRTRDLFSVECAALPREAILVGFHGREGISTLYRFEIGIALPRGAEIDMPGMLGSRIALSVDGDVAKPASFAGVVAGVELVRADTDASHWIVTMVPDLWHLTHSVHSRIFTGGTIPEIVEAVLASAGIPSNGYVLRLVASYAPREHVCQYKESDFAFINRLMERDGLYWYFEEHQGRERLVVTDSRSTHAEVDGPPVRYGAWQGEAGDRPAGLETFTCRLAALPAEVRLTDYDYLNPSLDVRGRAPVQSSGRGEIVLYGENFRTPDEGERCARIRAEQLLAGQRVYRASGSWLGLGAGSLFALEGHPLASLNERYLVTEVEHRGRHIAGATVLDERLGLAAEEGYRVELDAIPAEVQYRAPLRTAWPRVDGVVDGLVDGPAESAYAQVDEHGRYKVRVFFDESDLLDGSASTWIRMMQPHGGGTEGMHFPLRKETEVHIAFLGGDPDRPVIVGTAPNAHKPSKVTAANHSQNVIMTGGSNRLELEDQDGRQHVTLSTPALGTYLHMGTDKGDGKNLVASTDGNALESVGGNQDQVTKGYRNDSVGGPLTETFHATVTTVVGGAVTESYGATHTRVVAGAVTKSIGGTLTEVVSGAVQRLDQSTLDEAVMGTASYHYAANKNEGVDGQLNLSVGGTTVEIHKAAKSTAIQGAHVIAAAGSQDIQSFTSQTMCAPTQTFLAEGKQAHIGDIVAVQAGTVASVSAPTVTVHADGSVSINGAQVSITGGQIAIEGGAISTSGGNLVVNHGAVSITGGTVDVAGGVIKLN